MWRYKLYTAMSIPVFALLYLHTTLIVLLSIPCVLIRQKNCVRKVVHIWSVVSFLLTAKKVSVKGLEHVDRTKKYILVSNHASLFDIMAIMKVFPCVSSTALHTLQPDDGYPTISFLVPLSIFIMTSIKLFVPIKADNSAGF